MTSITARLPWRLRPASLSELTSGPEAAAKIGPLSAIEIFAGLSQERLQWIKETTSLLYRVWGVSIIGMTAMPEARLAREAELHYALIAQSTDYDCWRESTEVVSADMVVANVARNIATVRRALSELAPQVPAELEDACTSALAHAIQTAPEAINPEAVERLGIIYEKYAT